MEPEHENGSFASDEATIEREHTDTTSSPPAKRKLVGPILIMIIAVVCLGGVLILVSMNWFLSGTEVPPPAEEPAVDLTNVPGRDPEILGLRIDSEKGRMFFDRGTDQTLYVKEGECTGACLDDWVSFTASEPITEDGPLGTIERSDTGQLQYTWNDRPLFWYVMDTGNTTLGEGLNGEWEIARP